MRRAYMPHAITSALAAALSRMDPTTTYYTRGPDPLQKPIHDRRTSRYMPHQGERECARRRAQMARAASGK